MRNDPPLARSQSGADGKIIAPAASVWLDCRILRIWDDGALVAAAFSGMPPDRLYLWQARTGLLFDCEVHEHGPGTLNLRFRSSDEGVEGCKGRPLLTSVPKRTAA